MLIEKGRQMLRKDNLLDEEVAKKQDSSDYTAEQKMEILEVQLENLQTRFARLMAEFNSVQSKLKQRVSKLERHVHRDGDDISSTSLLRGGDTLEDVSDDEEETRSPPKPRRRKTGTSLTVPGSTRKRTDGGSDSGRSISRLNSTDSINKDESEG